LSGTGLPDVHKKISPFFSENPNLKWPTAVLTGARTMSQAIVDPVELRRFAQNLKKFNEELEERMSSLVAQLNSLSVTWRDQEHKKFTEDFEQHMKVIARYIEATNEHAPFLLRKADRIEEYLQQR
jgi:uncharacterized protein YukE